MLGVPIVYEPVHDAYIESAKFGEIDFKEKEDKPKQDLTLLWIIIAVMFIYFVL